VDPQLTVAAATGVARQAQAVIERVPDVTKAEIHLDVTQPLPVVPAPVLAPA
jgi:hypothetical protein